MSDERDIVKRLAERPESDALAWEAIGVIVGIRSANRRLRKLNTVTTHLLTACKAALEFVTDERWGTMNYMETDKVYADAAVLADLLRDVIKAAEG